MRSVLVFAVTVVLVLSGMLAPTSADKTDNIGKAKREIVGLTPQQVKWFTPSYYKDGRERAQLVGDSSKGGAWVDRVKIPGGKRVLAHTHPDDEMVTVIEGTWYLGAGESFDAARLHAYPAGSFVVIPAGLPTSWRPRMGRRSFRVVAAVSFALTFSRNEMQFRRIHV